jgi:histone H3/H4
VFWEDPESVARKKGRARKSKKDEAKGGGVDAPSAGRPAAPEKGQADPDQGAAEKEGVHVEEMSPIKGRSLEKEEGSRKTSSSRKRQEDTERRPEKARNDASNESPKEMPSVAKTVDRVGETVAQREGESRPRASEWCEQSAEEIAREIAALPPGTSPMIRSLLLDYESRLKSREDADRRESEKQAQKRIPRPKSSDPTSGEGETPEPDDISMKRPAGAIDGGSGRSGKAPKPSQSASKKKPPTETAPKRKETARKNSPETPKEKQKEKPQKPASVAKKRVVPSGSESGGDPQKKKLKTGTPSRPPPQVEEQPRRVTRRRGKYMFNPMNVAETRVLLAPDGLSARDEESRVKIAQIAIRNNGGKPVPIRVKKQLYESPPRDKHGLVIKPKIEENPDGTPERDERKEAAADPKKSSKPGSKKKAQPKEAPSSSDEESEDGKERRWTAADEDDDSASVAISDSADDDTSKGGSTVRPWGRGDKHNDDSSVSSRSEKSSEGAGPVPVERKNKAEAGKERRPNREEVKVEDASDEETDKPTNDREFITLGESPDEDSDEEPGEQDLVVEAGARAKDPVRLRGSGPPEGWTSDQSVLDAGDELREDEAPSDIEDTPEVVNKKLTKAAIRAINREERLLAGLPVAEEVLGDLELDAVDVCVAVRTSGVGQACYAYREVAGLPLDNDEKVYADDPSVRIRAEEAFVRARMERGIFSEAELRAQGVEVAQCEDLKDGIYRIRGGGRTKSRGGRPRKIDDSITREMGALQKHGELLVPKAAIMRLVREELEDTVEERELEGRWVVEYEAHTAIHEALENFATELFQDAVLGTIHAKRRTTQLEDMKLAGQLTGLAMRPDRDPYQPHPDPKVEKKRIVWKIGDK